MALVISLTGQAAIGANGSAAANVKLRRRESPALAFLVANRHRPVTRDELAEVLWGDDLPRSWDQLVRGIAVTLRAGFGAAGYVGTDVLRTDYRGYQLHLPADTVIDVEQAAGAVDAATAALRAGEPGVAEEEAGQAVEVAARQFLPGVTGAWVERRQAEVRELHVRGLEVLAEAAEARHDWAASVKAAEAAVELEPFRESGYVRLMSAHSRSGSRSEALGAYERCRRALSEELGVRPSSATETAYLALLGEDPDAAGGALPMPGALVPRSGAFFVGRTHEQSQLEAALARAVAEGPGAVLVAGEPGVGKTTLAAEFGRQAHVQGARVLYGRCDEDLSVPYQPFAQALNQYVVGCPISELEAHAAAHGGVLLPVVPELGRRLPGVAPAQAIGLEVDRYRMFQAAVALLATAGGATPVVLVLDDLHWAAKPTLLLLRFLLNTETRIPLLVVATYRDTEIGWQHPLAETLADLRRVRNVERLLMWGLEESDMEAFLKASDAGIADESRELARRIYDETQGNPFFVGELLRHRAERNSSDDALVPEGVREVVSQRVSRLSPAAGRALGVASVVGQEFSLDLVQRASGLEAVESLDEAVRARLVVERPTPRRYAFNHAIVRRSVYDDLGTVHRARLHREVGEAIEGMADAGDSRYLPALAHHFAEALPDGAEAKTVDYAVRAARQATEQIALEEAVAILERGLRALDSLERPHREGRFDLLVALADTFCRLHDMAGMKKAAAEAVQEAQALGSPERLGVAAFWRLWEIGPGDDGNIAFGVETLAAMGDASPGVRARLLARLCVCGPAAVADPDAGSREALDLARLSGDPDALGPPLLTRSLLLLGSEHEDELLELAEEMIAKRPPGSFSGWHQGPLLRARARLAAGDRPGFEADAAWWVQLAEDHREGTELALAERAVWRSMLALLDGRFDEVESLVQQTRAHAKLQRSEVQRWQLRLEQGRVDEALDVLRPALEEYANCISDRAKLVMLALTHARRGALDEARDAFDEQAALGLIVPKERALGLVLLSETCVRLGDQARAAELFDLLLPHAGRLVVGPQGAICVGAVDRYLGMLAALLGRLDEAAASFESAAVLEERVSAPPLVARTRYWWSTALAAAGDSVGALELADQALTTTGDLGMASLHTDASALLARLG